MNKREYLHLRCAQRERVDRHAWGARDDIFMKKNEKTKEIGPKIRLLCYMDSGT